MGTAPVTVFVLMLDGGYDGDSLLGVYSSERKAEEAGAEWLKAKASSASWEICGTYVVEVTVGAAATDYLDAKPL